MANQNQYTAKQFLDAIPRSGGIISTIADRVGCSWHTARKYIDEMPTVKAAYDDELEKQIDKAETLILKNIENAAKLAQQGEVVDTADARWFLSRKGKTRGYVERQEVTGANGGSIEIIDMSKLTNAQLERIANGEDARSVLTDKGGGRD